MARLPQDTTAEFITVGAQSGGENGESTIRTNLTGEGNQEGVIPDPSQLETMINERMLLPDVLAFLQLLSQKKALEDAATTAATLNAANASVSPTHRGVIPQNLFQTPVTPQSTMTAMDEPARSRQREVELTKTIRDLKSQVHRATSSAPDIDRVIEQAQQTPFAARISNADMRQVGKLKLSPYDGTKDPREHMTAFTIATGRIRVAESDRDAVLCQLFVESLSEGALKWFARIKPTSIDSFSELSQAFMKQYSILIKPDESTADLWGMSQNKGESLRSFIDRFKRVATKVTMDDAASIEALRRGLWFDSRFRETLLSSKPTTLEDALHRATVYINIEEERKLLAQQHASKTTSIVKEKPKDAYQEPRQHYDSYRDDRGRKGNATYQISDDPRSPLPWNKFERPKEDSRPAYYGRPNERPRQEVNSRPPANSFNKPNDNQSSSSRPYCEYHRFGGHSTSECKQLQEFLLNKFKKGDVPDAVYVRPNNRPYNGNRQYEQNRSGRPANREAHDDRPDHRQEQQPEQSRREREEPVTYTNPAKKRVINVIMGGLMDCNDSVRSLKERKRRAELPSSRHEQTDQINSIRGELPIIFSEADTEGLDLPHNDPLVINLEIGECNVTKVLIDIGSSVDLIYKATLAKMEIPESSIKPNTRILTAFDSRPVTSVGTIKLPVFAGTTCKQVKFIVIDQPSVYNVIMGTPWLHAMRAVPSSYHQCLRFPSSGAVFTIKGNQVAARTCFIAEKKLRTSPITVHHIIDEKPDITKARPTVRTNQEIVDMVVINPQHPEQQVGIGSQLKPHIRTKLEAFLRQHVSTFAWTMEDMVGIDSSIVTHELNVDPTCKPVRQKRRKLGAERAQAVNAEVDKLLKAKSICEVQYPDWLANPVVVKKKNGKWRVCVDFTDINKACPKDCFPLPHIDRLVEATAGNELLTFMDAFSGYNQIRMHPDDREKTAFITDRGTYCYKVMPFGLKNAGATYQRLVNKMFAEQLGKTMEVYIDDMLVKSPKAEDHINHLRTCFGILDKYGMKLNPSKCTFGVTSGEFLGYIVTRRGIEANPNQITAVLELPSPRNKREVQRLSGRIAALNRFIARSTDRCLPFYKLLRSNKTFEWDQRCEDAFQELKTYLSTPPILAKPDDGETLYLYVAVSDSAISGVLVKDDRGEQRPIIYISKAFDSAETRYTPSEKIALAIVTSARKLRPYFQSHPIVVLSDINIRTILHSPSQSGRLTKWAIELSEYDIQYQPRKVHKSQVLADFLVELPQTIVEQNDVEQVWELYVDGSATQNGSGVGISLKSPTGEVLEQALRLNFKATNNEAEYEALIAGLRLAKAVGVDRIKAHCDSQLVTSQYSGDYETKAERMEQYYQLVQKIAKEFTAFELVKIARSENKSADALAALATAPNPYRRTIPIDAINEPSIDLPKGVCAISKDDSPAEFPEDIINPADFTDTPTDPDWRTPFMIYIADGGLPEDKWEARRLKSRAAHYIMLDDGLFRYSASGQLLICVHGLEAERIMAETHEGAGGNHSGGRALALKVRKHGYYWPTMVADCEKFAAKCEKCQRHAHLINSPTELLQATCPPYPFMRWAMDIVGPLPLSSGKRYILVLTDYFTKWVEAKAYSNIEGDDVVKFLWRHVICRHGLPYEIVTDNGKNLTSSKVEDFCAKWRIRLNKSTPRYPQGNGQAEATNKTILDGLKKRLGKKKGNWSQELDGVLWSYRTTPKQSSGRSPFSLSHGVEALAPAEANVYTLRRSHMPANVDLNSRLLAHASDDTEEIREHALLRMQNYQQLVARHYNKKVHNRFFQEGDLVLRKVFENTKECNNKLGAKWEGPYQVGKVIKPGVYELITMSGDQLPHPWNSLHLKRYYY